MKWRAFGRMPQWVRLSDLLGRICGRLPTWTAMAKRAGNTTAQELGALGHGLERSGIRPTLTEQVPRCNKGRTQELTARRSTPARSANQQQDKAAFANWQGLHARTATGPMFLMVPAAASMPRTTTVRALS
jgi:hypothetical protein